MSDTERVEDDDVLSVWDPAPGNIVLLGLLGCGVWTGLVLLGAELPGWWSLAALLPGYAAVLAMCLLVTVPVKYTLTKTMLVCRQRGKVEELSLSKITTIAGHYMPRVGPQIHIYDPAGGFATLTIGEPKTTALLHRLGALVMETGKDR